MYTQCAHCKTLFRITAEQLKAARGRVRCGHCGEVFNALESLIEQLPNQNNGQDTGEAVGDTRQITEADAAFVATPAATPPAAEPAPAADIPPPPEPEEEGGNATEAEPAVAPVDEPFDRTVRFESLELNPVDMPGSEFSSDIEPAVPAGGEADIDHDLPSFDDLKAVFADLDLPDEALPAADTTPETKTASEAGEEEYDGEDEHEDEEALHIDLAGPQPDNRPAVEAPTAEKKAGTGTSAGTGSGSLSDREMSDIDALLKQLARDVESMTATMQRRPPKGPAASAQTTSPRPTDAGPPAPVHASNAPPETPVAAEPQHRDTADQEDTTSAANTGPFSVELPGELSRELVDEGPTTSPFPAGTPEQAAKPAPASTGNALEDDEEEIGHIEAFPDLDLPDISAELDDEEGPDELFVQAPEETQAITGAAEAKTRADVGNEAKSKPEPAVATAAMADADTATGGAGMAREHDDIPDILRTSLEEAARPRRGALATLAGTLFILILLAALLAQVAYFRTTELATALPALRPALTRFCELSGCQLPERRDLAHLVMLNQDIRTHPSTKGALQITATLENRADFRQPWPELRITLSDLTGNVVAARQFTPAEYLAHTPEALHQWRAGKGMPIDTPVNIELDVADPGRQAINYEFTFH